LTSDDDLLEQARKEAKEGDPEAAAAKLVKMADDLAGKSEYEQAAKVYGEAGEIYKKTYNAYECFKALDSATLMLIRLPQTPDVFKQIVNLNTMAAKVAEDATEYKKAYDYYFRAKDFTESEEEKKLLNLRAADALENLADLEEEEGNLSEAVNLLRKVGRLYFMADDEELGTRIYDRAVRVARRWAQKAKDEGNFLSAGNALAEAAQLMQTQGDSPEATRTMIDAGELYEAAQLYEKAGNIFDAAQEAYKLQRLTSARNQAMYRAAEAYLKSEGKPEVVAPLLVKGGNLFREVGRVMKAKWAFKRGSELFGELAKKAAKEKDIESEKRYLRYQAMCLDRWGQDDDADGLYKQVIDFYLDQAKTEAANGNKEQQAVALEEAAEVLLEAENKDEAEAQIGAALQLYVDLAEEASQAEDNEGASKFYGKAAECAKKLGDMDECATLHEKASERAEAAAEFYGNLGVSELATIWKRTAGREALLAGSKKQIEKAIKLLTESAKGFEAAGEPREAFEDLFEAFETRFMHIPDKRRPIKKIIKSMDSIAMEAQDEVMTALMSIIHSLNTGNHIGALLILQENEEELLQKSQRIRALIDQSKKVRP
jgi:tetratricopeptide (TPR) repeat protein